MSRHVTAHTEPFPMAKLGVIFAIVLVIAALLIALQRNNASTSSAGSAVKEAQSENPSRRSSASAKSFHSGTPAKAVAVAAPVQQQSEAPNPQVENMPKANLVEEFRGYQKQFSGYKLDNVELTHEGLALKADAGTSGPRVGSLESPMMTLKMPSNMVGPSWRAQLPADASVGLEIALSADGGKWTEWFAMRQSQDEVSPTYPDGRPNPYYGMSAADPIMTGRQLYPFMKYRITMSAAAEKSPLMQELQLYHLDSTLDKGYLANDPPPDLEKVADPPAALTQ